MAMFRKLTALTLLIGSIGLSGHALACPDRAVDAAQRADSISSKYKQIYRERVAVVQGAKPSMLMVCRLSREIAELEREWLDSLNIIKFTCPDLYNRVRFGESADSIRWLESNYERSQTYTSVCAQQGM
jgi:hypothetical protein